MKRYHIALILLAFILGVNFPDYSNDIDDLKRKSNSNEGLIIMLMEDIEDLENKMTNTEDEMELMWEIIGKNQREINWDNIKERYNTTYNPN